MASFWFEDRATDTYFSHPLKEGSTYQTDWSTTVDHTKGEWMAQRIAEFVGEKQGQTIWRRSTPTDLQRVDELICEFMGDDPPNPRFDSSHYYMCHELGFAALYKLGGSYVEQQHVTWIKERVSTQEFYTDSAEGVRARILALIDWVFLTKWRFCATG